MPTVFEIKESRITDTPLLLAECRLRDGRIERWSTHRVECDGATYEARILRHNSFDMQAASDQGVDSIPRVVLTLANADSHFSEIARSVGWKGAKLTVRFGFFDLVSGEPTTQTTTLFQGIANPPDEITESTFQLSAVNRLGLQRTTIPQVRLQRRCPWDFPATAEQRREAASGGVQGRYSRFFRCGYSPDVESGAGNLENGAPYTQCQFTRSDCEARGMFNEDSVGRPTRSFGGCEFVPASIVVRTFGDKSTQVSHAVTNEGRYNDFVPLVYGTAWYTPPVVLARNDGNLTHMEVLLGMGEVEGVLKVLVNEIEVPAGSAGRDMGGTGWYNLVSRGNRTGTFNLDFQSSSGSPSGDPYGSMAYLSVVVPNRVSDGRGLPTVKVLVAGLKLPTYAIDGAYTGDAFTNNPVWVLLDLLMRCGWLPQEMDLSSFAEAAAYCGERIAAPDNLGNPITAPRFQCNLAIQARRSAASLVRGIRNGSRLFLTYGASGKLELRVENTVAGQQPTKPAWSNATNELNGGWPSYEFDERSILRRPSGEPAIRLWSRPAADTPNRFSVEFQDALNDYQHDSFSLVDVEDVAFSGQEVSAVLNAVGIPSVDQAARMLKFNLDRSLQGNTYIEFETSVKGIGIHPGDLIAVTYSKEGFQRQPFRVLRIAAGLNCGVTSISAQIHSDDWYTDTNGQAPGGSRRPPYAGTGLPRPLAGSKPNADGELDLDIVEAENQLTDGGTVRIEVGFIVPQRPSLSAPGAPLVSLAAVIHDTGGSIAGNQSLNYAVSGLDAEGRESPLSFIVRADIPAIGSANCVELRNLGFSPGTETFNVYRGYSPANLFRIATGQSLAPTFLDTGVEEQPVAPSDQNFDHANFYWRLSLTPELGATLHSARTVGNTAGVFKPDELSGMRVRITSGRGKGQERTVVGNDANVVTIDVAWETEPDATSRFAVSEAGWHFGASSQGSPVAFEVPNRGGAVVEICGRAANWADIEAPYELSPVTRWMVGGGSAFDTDVPPRPLFGLGLSTVAPGAVEIGGISFSDLTNTRTIGAATAIIYYWSEIAGEPGLQLLTAISESDTELDFDGTGTVGAGSVLQIDAELMRVEEAMDGTGRCVVNRGHHGSEATVHDAGATVYQLSEKASIMAFPRDFFGSPASGGWVYTILLPDARVASCELFVTNTRGKSEPATACFTGTADFGLRTLSGGQLVFQIEGFLAVENGATPDLHIDATHAVRDVFAVVRHAPQGNPIEMRLKQDGIEYCTTRIDAGAKTSGVVNGLYLPPLRAGSTLSLDVLSVGSDVPGSDLNLIVRL